MYVNNNNVIQNFKRKAYEKLLDMIQVIENYEKYLTKFDEFSLMFFHHRKSVHCCYMYNMYAMIET